MLTEEMKDFIMLLFEDKLIIERLEDVITVGELDELIQSCGCSFTAKEFLEAVEKLMKAG